MSSQVELSYQNIKAQRKKIYVLEEKDKKIFLKE